MISEAGNRILERMPPYYLTSYIMRSVWDAQGHEIDRLNDTLDEILEQFFVDTATWGLELWEQFLGLPIDKTKPEQFRRERIKAKLRGYGTVTKGLIKNVASAFANGEVEVIEYPSEYKFVVKFVGVKGIPPNMSDLTKTIEEIKPAHLNYEYQYTYNVWNLLTSKVWNDLAHYTWEQVRVI